MIEIRYCVRWNYYPRAVRLAEQIKESIDLDIQLSSGKIGELSVYYNQKKISNKGDSVQKIVSVLRMKIESQ